MQDFTEHGFGIRVGDGYCVVIEKSAGRHFPRAQERENASQENKVQGFTMPSRRIAPPAHVQCFTPAPRGDPSNKDAGATHSSCPIPMSLSCSLVSAASCDAAATTA